VTAKKKTSRRKPGPQYRFGIGEWYGKSFARLSPEERKFYADIQGLPDDERPPQLCPFLSRAGQPANCSKSGGICSLRSYQRLPDGGVVTVDPRASTIRTTCPNRFEEAGTIYRWIGKTLLGNEFAVAVGETPFLERAGGQQSGGRKKARKVGRIDNVLVVPGTGPLNWCPVEKQAVYFSGKKMALEFKAMSTASTGESLPFPLVNRRPDYRSSGPKRLLPQLEIKVPTLSTWGKKMAVVVDADFFSSLGTMREANDLSNAELAWFVVEFVDQGTSFSLQPKQVFVTRLRDAIEGLVAAVPIPRPQFEEALRSKLQRLTSANRDSDQRAVRS
jgi:hypothetical protein